MLESHLKASNLKRWLADPDSPQAVKDIKSLFDRVYASKAGAASSDHYNEPEPRDGLSKPVPRDLRPLLTDQAHKVQLQARYKRLGIIYATAQTHTGNSQILYHPGGDKRQIPVAGIIKYIYSEREDLFIAVQRAEPVHASINDPFANYPHWPARLYSSSQNAPIERILPTWVQCHFARWDCSQDHMVVLSLDRVCCSLKIILSLPQSYLSGMNTSYPYSPSYRTCILSH